jgi:hypothetical protein
LFHNTVPATAPPPASSALVPYLANSLRDDLLATSNPASPPIAPGSRRRFDDSPDGDAPAAQQRLQLIKPVSHGFPLR